MNWAGALFGIGLALALIGGAGAAFAQRSRTALRFLAGAMAGIAAACLALGNEFIALLTLLVLGAAVPAALAAALVIAPAPDPDVRPGRGRAGAIATVLAIGLAGLGWLLTRASWITAGGARQNAVEWLGSRLLTDHLLALELAAALLAVTGLGIVALLRGRASRTT